MEQLERCRRQLDAAYSMDLTMTGMGLFFAGAIMLGIGLTLRHECKGDSLYSRIASPLAVAGAVMVAAPLLRMFAHFVTA